MHLSEVTLKNFRSYGEAQFVFDTSLTLVTGKNGAGKTNLLEAVYVLLQGSSFRVADKEMIRAERDWWRIDGVLDGDTRQVRYQLAHHPPKQLQTHGNLKRFMHSDRLPVVLFEPSELQLIHGSPTRRRDNLDTMLSALSKHYRTTLTKYERVLRQRNNALKQHLPNLEDRLFAWDVLLSEYGIALLTARQQLVDDLNSLVGGFYGEIAGTIEALSIQYHTNLGRHVTASRYIAQLHDKLAVDKLRGTTSVGPHRDDVTFLLRGSDARQTASRGETRTILLALKLAYCRLLEASYEDKPLVLLDDVFSELDDSRQTKLLQVLGDNQVIITDTKHPTIHGTHLSL